MQTIRTGNFKWVHAPMVVKIFCCRRRKPNSCQKLPTIIYMINKRWVCTTYTINSPEFVNTYKVSTCQIIFQKVFFERKITINQWKISILETYLKKHGTSKGLHSPFVLKIKHQPKAYQPGVSIPKLSIFEKESNF